MLAKWYKVSDIKKMSSKDLMVFIIDDAVIYTVDF